MSSNPVIVAKGLGKAYRLYEKPQDRLKHTMLWRFNRHYGREFWALRDVSFKLHPGEMLGIVGRNGSGKSTLLQMLAGILQPTQGSVTVNGRLAALLELGSGFNPEFTGRENIYLNASILGISPSEIELKIDDIIAFAEIGDFIDQPVKLYSSGMFVRLAFAVTTGLDADILLIDEALAVGDVFFKQKCYQRLQDLLEQGVAVILVTHNTGDVAQFCQNALLLSHGYEVFQGTSSETLKHYMLLEQQERSGKESSTYKIEEEQSEQTQNTDQLSDDWIWPNNKAFFSLANTAQVNNGAAQAIRIAITDAEGNPKSIFEQGEQAHFFYEFEALESFPYPSGGLMIKNARGVSVHGKNSFEYLDTVVPSSAENGSLVRFHQTISLDIENGEYTFEIGLTSLDPETYDNRSVLSPQELRDGLERLSHVPECGMFRVIQRKVGKPTLLMHRGLCNLPGDCQTHTISRKEK